MESRRTAPLSIGPQAKRSAILLAVIVYVPLVHNALLGPPAFIPWQINEFWRITQIFPYRTSVWPVNLVYVQGADEEWRQVSQAPVFRHTLFGQMTRMDMLLLMLRPHRTEDATTLELKKRVFAGVCGAFVEAHGVEDGEAAAVLQAEGYPPIARPVRAARLVTVWLPVEFERKPTRRWWSWPPVDYAGLRQEITFECQRPSFAAEH
jgi:hypothetical protein